MAYCKFDSSDPACLCLIHDISQWLQMAGCVLPPIAVGFKNY